MRSLLKLFLQSFALVPLVASTLCACGGTTTTSTISPSRPEPKPQVDLQGREFLTSVSVIVPEGYNPDGPVIKGSLFLKGESGVIIAFEGPDDTEEGLDACVGFAAGFATGILTSMMGKKPGEVSLETVAPGPLGENGCRTQLAPAVGSPAIFEVALQKFGTQAVIVVCSLGDERQTTACATLKESIVPTS